MSEMHDKSNRRGRKKNAVAILQKLHENQTVKHVKTDTKTEPTARGRCIFFNTGQERIVYVSKTEKTTGRKCIQSGFEPERKTRLCVHHDTFHERNVPDA